MKKTNLTRSLLAACSIVALSVVVYGCSSGPSQSEFDAERAAKQEAEQKAADEAAAKEEAEKKAAEEEAAKKAAEEKAAEEEAAKKAAEEKAAEEEAARMAAERKAQEDAAAAEAKALADAQMAASDAAAAAKAASDAASAAVTEQAGNAGANQASFDTAQEAANAAMAAYMAAKTASDMAAMATDSATAIGHRATAEMQQGVAENARNTAVEHAGMVAGSQAELDRMAAVSDARMRAMQSYMDADADATKAEGQADEAEATAPGTPGAMAARDAATAARTAANAAKDAHDAIMDDMTKMEADAKAQEAADEAGNANSSYMTAKDENNTIQTASGVSNEQNRVRDVAAATTAAGEAATAARTAATNARTHATNARTAADAAKASYMRAKSARTDSAEANTQYMAADAAATAAENAATAAEMAAGAAETAHMGIDSAGSAAAAQAAQQTAEDRQGDAEGSMGTAYTQMGTANTARDDAMTAADTHVVGLLMMANAVHITTAADPNANVDDTEVGLIETNRLNHVAGVNTAVHVTTGGPLNVRTPTLTAVDNQGGGTVNGVATDGTANTANATYPYYASLGDDNAFGGEGDNADTGPGEGKPMISVNPSTGDAVVLVHAGPGADGMTGTTDDIMANFDVGPGLGDFIHEKYFGRNNDTNNDGVFDAGETRQRIILFTDIEQANAPADAITASVVNVSVSASRIDTLGTAGTGDAALNYEDGEYDHDGDPNTATMTGDFTCTDPATCSITVQGGEVQSISGYTFTSDPNEVIVAAVASEEDDTYLAFGVWLQETAAAGTNTYAFGAFADGGAAVGDTDEPSTVASVTGDATYTGKAAGVHATATAVDFFHADATLNAKFGDGTATGTITGMIHNIMSGGRSVGHDIELLVADPGATTETPNIVDAGTFSGQTRMGPVTGQNDHGEAIYQMTGDWSGTFYNHMANVATTTIDESTRAPGSVAGTFGVGMADDADTMMVDETESFVGAFGAHCSSATNCNPN